MNDSYIIMKKLLLATIIATVFVSGTIVGMIPFASAVGPGVDPIIALERRLNHVVNILDRAQERLDEISEDVGSGPSEDPAVRAALLNIIDRATLITNTAQGMLCGPTACP